MLVRIPEIPMREVLHFLGWRGTPIEEHILRQIRSIMDDVQTELNPHVTTKYFDLDSENCLIGSIFTPKGKDVSEMLRDCGGAILMAATLGAQSERMLLRFQARSSAEALLADAVLSAAIEAVCDKQEQMMREAYLNRGFYLTDRFSPGYGDMPLEQTREICAVLQTEKSIGLNVAHSGLMIPRKSVTAILGVSRKAQARRPSPCADCSMRKTCALREKA